MVSLRFVTLWEYSPETETITETSQHGMWSDQPWCNHPGRSITEHGGMFACQVQLRTRLLAKLICVALLIASQQSLFSGEKKQKREKFLYKKYLWGSFLPLPPALLTTNPFSHSHRCCAKLHYTPACGIRRDHVWTPKKPPDLNKHLTLSHQDVVWTGKFCPVKLSNFTNYSVQTLIETTPWKGEGNWCAAAWQSWTVAARQQFLSHESCKSEFNLSNQPLYITSRTQIYHHPGICALRSVFLGCQHLVHVSGGASKSSCKIDLGLHA